MYIGSIRDKTNTSSKHYEEKRCFSSFLGTHTRQKATTTPIPQGPSPRAPERGHGRAGVQSGNIYRLSWYVPSSSPRLLRVPAEGWFGFLKFRDSGQSGFGFIQRVNQDLDSSRDTPDMRPPDC